MRARGCLIIVLLVLAFPHAIWAGELSKSAERAYDSIRPMDVYDLCKKISSNEFAGRLTGDAGYTAAAKWAAAKFEEWGLEPIDGAADFLQPFPSPYTIVDEAEMTLFLPHGERALEMPRDFLPLFYAASGDATAEAVFAGWGISAPALGYDDYEGLDIAGKFVLCFRGTPDPADTAYEHHDQHRTRMRTAKEKGAAGLIYIYEKPQANPNGDWIEGFLPAEISESAADSLFAGKGLSCAAIRKGLAESKRPASFPLSARVRHRVSSRHFPDGVGYNVAGMIEGSDPALRNECVVIGGHFDHCGSHAGLIFPGANDNASGSAVVMEIAAAYARLGEKPKRSVLFVLFGGEEMGLLGSTHFAEHLPARFSKVAGMFNFDMVGEGDGASCGYSANPPELLDVLEEAGRRAGNLHRTWEIKHVGVRSSDFAPFFLGGAPCAACFSNGPHLAYHEPGDTIYRINPDILADIAQLGFLASYEWANRPKKGRAVSGPRGP